MYSDSSVRTSFALYNAARRQKITPPPPRGTSDCPVEGMKESGGRERKEREMEMLSSFRQQQIVTTAFLLATFCLALKSAAAAAVAALVPANLLLFLSSSLILLPPLALLFSLSQDQRHRTATAEGSGQETREQKPKLERKSKRGPRSDAKAAPAGVQPHMGGGGQPGSPRSRAVEVLEKSREGEAAG